MKTKEATCIYFRNLFENSVLMAYQQKKVIGLKGFGGKIKKGQSILENLKKEVDEETGAIKKLRINKEEKGGIIFDPQDAIFMGTIDFYNGTEQEVPFGKPSFRTHFFVCDTFSGRAISTIEMFNPKFYSIAQLPLKEMIVGDEYFIPYILKNIHVSGYQRKNKDLSEIIHNAIIYKETV